MNNEIVEHTIKTSQCHRSAKRPPRFYSEVCNFCAEERTVCISTWFFYRLGYKKPTYEQIQVVWKFTWGKDVTSYFGSSVTTEIRRLQNKSSNTQRTRLIIAFLAQQLYVHWTHLRDKKFKSSHLRFSTGGCGRLGTRLLKYVRVGNGKQSINLEWPN